MRECLNNSVVSYSTSSVSELCGKLDKIGRFCSCIALTHLGVNVKLYSLALCIIFSLRRFFRTEESGYS